MDHWVYDLWEQTRDFMNTRRTYLCSLRVIPFFERRPVWGTPSLHEAVQGAVWADLERRGWRRRVRSPKFGGSPGAVYGSANHVGQWVWLSGKLKPYERTSILVHEWAHTAIHSGTTTMFTLSRDEVEAELTAASVCAWLGCQWMTPSIYYMATYGVNAWLPPRTDLVEAAFDKITRAIRAAA